MIVFELNRKTIEAAYLESEKRAIQFVEKLIVSNLVTVHTAEAKRVLVAL